MQCDAFKLGMQRILSLRIRRNIGIHSELLRLCGYDLLEAQDGEGGIRLAIEATPDLIVCDLHLPARGRVFHTRDDPQKRRPAHVPFHLPERDSDPLHIHRGLNLGAEAYLVKPVSANEFVTEVRRHLHCPWRICDPVRRNRLQPGKPRPEVQPAVNVKRIRVALRKMNGTWCRPSFLRIVSSVENPSTCGRCKSQTIKSGVALDRQANASLPVLRLQQVISTKAQQLGNEIPIFRRNPQ